MKSPLDQLTDRDELEKLLAQLGSGRSRYLDPQGMADALRQRIRGQDHVIDEITTLMSREWAKEQRTRPIASLLFLGPTGTGKTQLAKVIAEYLYGDERNLLRFDCQDLTGDHSKTMLFGTPRGYQGSDSGGLLTRPMLSNPKRLILFDEIEKAWPGVFDLFLSIMGDGRLMEQGSGKVADFTQSVIILTSNAEQEAIGEMQRQEPDPLVRSDAIKRHLRDAKVFRPEILARLDKICVFKPLERFVQAEICGLSMQRAARQYGLELRFIEPDLLLEATRQCDKVKEFGSREFEKVIDAMIAPALMAAKYAGTVEIGLRRDERGNVIAAPSSNVPCVTHPTRAVHPAA